jgi:hypothetical protein
MADKRTLIVNPAEPRTGDNGFTVYDDAHPLNGKPYLRDRFRSELRGLRGHTLTITVKGERQEQNGKSRYWTARRTIELQQYGDIFGANGVLLSALKSQMKRDSNAKLVVTSITIEDDTGEEDEEEE